MGSDLIREFTRAVLAEDAGADWGIRISPGLVYNTLVNPFIDVFRVAGAEVRKLSVSMQRLARTVIEAVVATAVPFVTGEFKKIKETERERLAAIDRRYADVYARVRKGIEFPDFHIALFMADPPLYLSHKIAKMPGPVAREVLDALTGRVREAQQGAITQRDAYDALVGSAVLRDMQRDAVALRGESLDRVADLTTVIAMAKNLSDVREITGKDINAGRVHGIPAAHEKAITDAAKSAALGKIVNSLRKDAAGLPAGSPLISVYEQKIKTMAKTGGRQ